MNNQNEKGLLKLNDRIITRAKEKALKLGQSFTEKDVFKVSVLIDKMKKGPLVKVWDEVTVLWNAFNAPDVPKSTKAIIIGSLLYMVLPIDVVPDAFFPLGLLDDVAVITFVFAKAKPVFDAVKKSVDERIEDKYADLEYRINEGFSCFSKNLVLNSTIKLLFFITASLLLYFSKPEWTVAIYASSILLWAGSLIIVCTWIGSFIKGIRFFFKVLGELKNSTEKTFTDKCLISFYKIMSIESDSTGKKKPSKVFIFLLRLWNHDKLPDVVPSKAELIKRLTNMFIKKRIIIFMVFFILYIITFNFLFRPMILKSVTSLSLLQLYLYPLY